MTDSIKQCGRTFVHAEHTTTDGTCPGLEHAARHRATEAWRQPPSYEQLVAGLRVIASDAVMRDDNHVAAYAYLALAGEPFPTDDVDLDSVPRAFVGEHGIVITKVPDTGVLVLPEHIAHDAVTELNAEHTQHADVATGAINVSDSINMLLEQAQRDRRTAYWFDRIEQLDGVESWLLSLRDHIGG